MKVLITGGMGLIGKATTERLIQRGWDVRVIGMETEATIPGVEFATCDILNYDALREHMRGCQAVIHLAAIRGPQLAPSHTIFDVNVKGTFNVFDAAAKEGIRRVVQASSINAIGCFYNLHEMNPQYLPIDEDHSILTTDPYSYSKELIEDIGRYFWRRDGISSVALRFPGVYKHGHLESDRYRENRQRVTQLLDNFAALSDSERAAQLAILRQQEKEWRDQRPFEYTDHPAEPFRQLDTVDPLRRAYSYDRSNFWALLDERDAALSLEQGVVAEYEGAHALFINDSHNYFGYESSALARLFFPEIEESKVKLAGSEALVSINKARALIGFEPEYSVKNWE